jgi:hypothetical protein
MQLALPTMLMLKVAQALLPRGRHSFARQMSSSTFTPESLFQSLNGKSCIGNNVGDAMYSLYTADAVCFDVDSTVIAEEGIDVLAEYLGQGEKVAALTLQAMEGGMKFQEALQLRLDLLQPSKQQILTLLKESMIS